MQPRPVLSDMPDHIKQRIVDSLDTITKRSISRCSIEFKAFFDTSPLHYHQLILQIRSLFIRIRITMDRLNPMNKLEIEFHSHPRGYLVQNENENFEKLVEGSKGWLEGAAEHFLKIWKHPRVTVKNFYLSVFADSTNSLADFLEHLNRSRGSSTLSSELFNVYFGSDSCVLHPILCILKPGHLKEIWVQGYPGDTRVLHVDEAGELNVWQEAKKLTVEYLKVDSPVLNLTHFEEMRIKVSHLALGMVKSLVENFIARNHDFIGIAFETSDTREILEYLKRFEVLHDTASTLFSRLSSNVLGSFGSTDMYFSLRRG